MNEKTPLTDEQITMDGLMMVPSRITDVTEWFIQGVRFAERAHGIGTGAAPAGYEHDHAIMEAHRNASVESYFSARHQMLRTLENTRVYEAGFDRGWAARGTAAPAETAPQPIDMVLHCPKCGMQHIDAPEDEIDMQCNTNRVPGLQWDNRPHRSHLCHGCGHIWRPADVPTNGVQTVKTKGKDDSPIAAPQPARDPAASKSHDVAREASGGVVEALRSAEKALDEILTCGRKVKNALNAGIPEGEPAHPQAAALTWPLSSAVLALGEIRAALAAHEAAEPPAVESGPSEAALRDAERYRWLRNGEISAEYPYPVMRSGGDRLTDRTIWDDELDAAIDAAIAASKENKT